MRSDAAKGLTLSAPATLYVGFLVAAPLAILVAYSLWTQTYVSVDRTLTLANYKEAFTDPLVRHLMSLTMLIAGAVTIVTVALAYPIAYFIALKAERKTLWLLLITIPFWSSYLLRVFAWKLILGFNGVLNSALLGVGMISEPLTFLLYNEFAVVLTLAHAWAPFAILPIFVALEKIDRSLLEAAEDLGDGPVRRFVRVTLPLSTPGIIGACLVIFIPTVGDYVTPALVGGTNGLMIGNMIQVQFGKAGNFPLGAALAMSAMLIVASISLIFVVTARYAATKAR